MGLEHIAQVPENRAEAGQNHDARKTVPATLSVKLMWGYISAQKPEGERFKSFAVSISLQNKAITT